MKKICWWRGTDALTLIKNPPGNKIWYIKLFFYRLKWKYLKGWFDEHWVNHIRLIRYLRMFGFKGEIQLKHNEPWYNKVYCKIEHKEFNVLYYCSAKPINIGGMKYIHWLYGWDIFTILQQLSGVKFIHVSGSHKMGEVYPLIDLYIRPTRHDGYPRMIKECLINNIPYYWSENGKPDIKKISNIIKSHIKYGY